METGTKSNGALVGLIIIIIILIVGGMYMWHLNVVKMRELQMERAAIMAENAKALDALGADIQNTDTNVGVDATKVK